MFRDDSFLCNLYFTLSDVLITPNKLIGGWSSVYRKVEHRNFKMISLHDVKKTLNEIPDDFFEKYKRRFHRLYEKILNNDKIFLTHCFDFQWMKPYYPTLEEINLVFKSCNLINPTCNVYLYFLIHPKYQTNDNKKIFDNYLKIKNVGIFYLDDKGYRTDWKADNLTFDNFFNEYLKN